MEQKIVVEEECFCEHCGDLEPFSLVYSDEGAYWCMDCAQYNEEFNTLFTWTDIKEKESESISKKIQYFSNRIHSLAEKLAR